MQEVRAALTHGLSLPDPVALGARAHAEPADLPQLDGEVVRSDDERIKVSTSDGIHTFLNFAGTALMFHHLFGPDTEGAEAAWQQWLTGLRGWHPQAHPDARPRDRRPGPATGAHRMPTAPHRPPARAARTDSSAGGRRLEHNLKRRRATEKRTPET